MFTTCKCLLRARGLHTASCSAAPPSPSPTATPTPEIEPVETIVASPVPELEATHAGPVEKRKPGRPKKVVESPLPPLERVASGIVLAEPDAPPTAQEQVEQVLERLMGIAERDPDAALRLMKEIEDHELTVMGRDHFASFCQAAWHVVEPATRLTWNWHHELLCNVLQALFESWLETVSSADPTKVTPIRNCVINCPPGSLKSKLISVFFPAWVWLRKPGAKLVCISVNEMAAMRDARSARDLVKSDWFVHNYQPDWKLKADQDAVSNYGNTAGGERLSKPSGATIVGLRGDFLIGDDLNDPLEAENVDQRKWVNQLWDTNQSNRVNKLTQSVRICVQQRVHVEDHTGHVIDLQGTWSPQQPDGWLHVVLSAEHDPERAFAMPEVLVDALQRKLGANFQLVTKDPRTTLGQSVDEIRLPLSELNAERRRWEGTGNYAGQMLQRPAFAEGAKVKRDYWGWFRLASGVREDVDELETGRPRPAYCLTTEAAVIPPAQHRPGYWDFDWVVISVDCAVKKTEKGSNWGMVVIAGRKGRRYVLDDGTKRGDIFEVVEVMRTLIKRWHPDMILIEGKAASEDLKLRLIGEMTRGDMPMVTLEETNPGTQNKEERLTTCLPLIANGLVSLLDGAPWLEAFVEELSTFPVGARDDRVDALSQCLNHFMEDEEDGADEMPGW